MRSIRSFFLLAVAVVGVFGSIATAQSNKGGINDRVYHAVRGLQRYNTFDHITWQVSGSTVTLSGRTISIGTRHEIENAVKDIAGVTQVVNNIRELPPSSFDDAIRQTALAEFTNRGPAQYFGWPNPDVHVIVENGRITLEGFVARKSDSDTLNILSHSIPGVFEVTNNLVVGQRPRY